MTPFTQVQPVIDRDDPATRHRIADMAEQTGVSLDEMFAVYERSQARDAHYINGEYQVVVIEHEGMLPCGMTQLSIQRLDGRETPWKDKQAIKNMFLGENAEAVELYPAESRLMDTAPNYHLWSMGIGDFVGQPWPFGIFNGRIVLPHPKSILERAEEKLK